MRNRALALVLLAAAAQDTADRDYAPLQAGNTWTYSSTMGLQVVNWG